ncbi:hypothetical protein ACN38_g168 [Penicillium nordicum]|uniref:Uncharacterized protein n=1 Tax=Penicillium nordicum TaxID=229535 RepID=A0A0M8PHN6_9EURO|nr:hypothetical protein ACN38_g168 [Penicillium nordicum]
MIRPVPAFKYIGLYCTGPPDLWHSASLHTTCPLGRDVSTRANPAGSTQDAEKFGFTKDGSRAFRPLAGV